MIKKLVLSAVAGLGLLVSVGSSAQAAQETYVYSGVTCEGVTPSDTAKLVFNGYGILNNSTAGSALVICSMPTRPAQFVAAVNIQGYDRNSGAGIDCELEVLDFNGNSFIVQQHRGTTAALNQVAPTSFNFTSTPSSAYGMTMLCTIPAATAQGASGITSMRVTTNL
jgi:hypothetical protein